MIAETQVGIQNLTVGAKPTLRSDRTAAITVVDGSARYQESVVNNNVFGFIGTTTAIAAGQIMGGAAAGSLNFALLNPVGSGKNLVLWQYGLGISVVTTTGVVGAIFHGMLNCAAVNPTLTGMSNNAYNLSGNNSKPSALVFFHASGTAFTGGIAPFALYMTPFGVTNTGTTGTAIPLPTVDNIDGKIIVPPGLAWLPLFISTGTSMAYNHSIIWEEIPL